MTPDTPQWIKKSWNERYEKYKPTDWEKLPLDDLKKTLCNSGIALSRISSVLDIGCGRGLRTLILLLGLDPLNRREVYALGLDVSEDAIAFAKRCYNDMCQGNLCQEIQPYLGNVDYSKPQCMIEFRVGDIIEGLPVSCPQEFDLVIDWMCFHEIWRLSRNAYVEIVSKICKKFFLLKVFSKEEITIVNLNPNIKEIPKFQYSESDVRRIFGKKFSILRFNQWPEILSPNPAHSDGQIAAKRAYLMVRKH